MLRTTRSDNGVLLLTSPLLDDAGVRHAFSTRLGGVSAAPFDALNLQSTQANARTPAGEPRDNDEALRENLRRFVLAAGLSPDATVVDASQVHGCDVVRASAARRVRTAADAIVGMPGDEAMLVRIADCVPILLADRRTGAVAAVHAGWRGVVAGVVTRAVDALVACGSKPEELVAAIGPCISARHFEIGPEVADALAGADLGACVVDPGVHGPKHHADLVAATRAQLERCGLGSRAIDAEPPCTFAEPLFFHSFRRDGARSGRLAALIAPRAATRNSPPTDR